MEVALNASEVICELCKGSQLFEILSSPEYLDKISLGLESKEETTVRATLLALNQIMREYSKDGTNKRVNISNFSEEEDKLDFDMLSPQEEEAVKLENEEDEEEKEKSGELNLSGKEAQEESITDAEKKFLASISALLPLVQSFIKQTVKPAIQTTYGKDYKPFGTMRY